ARYASLNPASGRVMEKAGMSYLQTIVNGVERKGYLADLIYYGISREEC
ncbi:N-acetyltransferase, partial [Streptococcus pneumoniae]|nr:N-acetyltransferase [Streptococcus pneumoniae]